MPTAGRASIDRVAPAHGTSASDFSHVGAHPAGYRGGLDAAAFILWCWRWYFGSERFPSPESAGGIGGRVGWNSPVPLLQYLSMKSEQVNCQSQL